MNENAVDATTRAIARELAVQDLDKAIDTALDGTCSAIAAWKRYFANAQPNTWGEAVEAAQLRAIDRRKPETDAETKRIQTCVRQTAAEAALYVLDPKIGAGRPQPQKRAIGRKILDGASLSTAMKEEREEREAREAKKKEKEKAPVEPTSIYAVEAPPASTLSKDIRYAMELCDELAGVVAELPAKDREKVAARLLSLIHGAQAKDVVKKAA